MSKKMLKINAVLLVLLMVLMVIPMPSVFAFSYNGTKLNTAYTMVFVPDQEFGATSISHFNDALYKWNSASGYTLMRREPTLRHNLEEFPTPDDTSQIIKFAEGDIEAPGAAKRYTSFPNFRILRSADILINSEYTFVNSTNPDIGEFDTYTVFLHEAGHVAGLDHPLPNSVDPSVMFAYNDGGVCMRTPTTIDRAAIAALYENG